MGGGKKEAEVTRVTPAPLAPRPTATQIGQEQLAGFQAIQPQLEGLFPGAAGLSEALIQQLTQGLQTPQFISPEEQQATEAIRGRQREATQRAIQTSANLGGGLFGGRREQREDVALTQLAQQFAQQDVQQRLQRQQMLFGAATPLALQQQQLPFQFLPTTGGTQQDILQRALAEQPQTFVSPGEQKQRLGFTPGGQLGLSDQEQIQLMLLAAGASSKRYKENIKLWGKPSTLSAN